MVERKTAFFRFEASPTIGAGHAIRSCVIADALVGRGWECCAVTTKTSYEFIKSLERFKRIEPDQFYENPVVCDLFVVDNYDLDQTYEQHFRPFAQKILVIDDLANRPHECDVLVDQTYGRAANDYKSLVPDSCVILTGGDYALIRKEFVELRPKALEKRRNTTEIKRILVSLGGSDSQNYTAKVLDIIQHSEFKGSVDIVLGFSGQNNEIIQKKIIQMSNGCSVYIDPDIAKLMCDADLAIGASGSSMWERCVLGLPTMMFTLSCDQGLIANNLHEREVAIFAGNLEEVSILTVANLLNGLINDKKAIESLQQKSAFSVCDGTGIDSILKVIHGIY